MVYAIIESGGKQHVVSQGDLLTVELLDAKDTFTFENVLLISDNDKVAIGTPYVPNAKVTAQIIEHFKDKKKTSFKYKAKVNYHRTIGHRQPMTRVKIEAISHGA